LDNESANQPKLSIGIPVFNGEKFLHQCFNSLLSQTFTDFELIISDNASTDSTSNICKEYSKKFKNFRYIRQDKNIGMKSNFFYVLQKASCDYFIWVGIDDILLPDFLKKNLEILQSKKNLVGSVSKIKFLDSNNLNETDLFFKNFIRKLRNRFRIRGTYSISGSFEKKVRFYLTKSTCGIIYGIFKTDELQKSIISEEFEGSDWCINLNLLKQGDIHVIDEILMHKYEGSSIELGIFSKALLDYNKKHHRILGLIFPWMPFTLWCTKNLGSKIFIKNFDYFFKLNLEGVLSQIIDLIRLFVAGMIKISKMHTT